MGLRAAGIASSFVTAVLIMVNGLLLQSLIHPRAVSVASPISQLSDRGRQSGIPVALGVLLGVDGMVALLSRFTDGAIVVVALGLGMAVQVVVLAWTATIWFESGVARHWFVNRTLRHDLRAAMLRNEIVPYYQPIIRASDNRCVGYEALARWEHPSRGVLVAGSFLDLAESRGYLAAIDRSVLLAVARDLPGLMANLDADEPFVSINLSPRRLEQRGFADEILRALDHAGLSSDGLMIEMTENTAVSDWATLTANIAQLQEVGITLAVDDFGTGHANLSLLCQLDVDMIKLDRELVELAMGSPRGAAVVHAAIRAGQATGALIVAEGVSNSGWITELSGFGVDLIQGFGVGHPQPAHASHGKNFLIN
jgi:EAL domain-containing protein (putative c-di-GMP-specific phosphodiesterase class I)